LGDANFGCHLPQSTNDLDQIIEVAKYCERLGYDSGWAYDHLSPYWLHSGGGLECWTLLSAIAARTSKIRIGSLVTNVNLRNPALLAKMSSTVDSISGGRLIVGLGTGDRLSAREMRSYGYPFPSMNERVDLLRDTILILKAMWRDQPVSLKGKIAWVTNALSVPRPEQMPPIWVGGKHPKILDIVAELADGWNYWGLDSRRLRQCETYLLEKCAKLRRNPEDIIKSWAGTLTTPTRNRDHPKIVEAMRTELLAQTDRWTKYFIASFGPTAPQDAYRAFADAVRSLT
jgi:alkanesulfonate monooxygenase SsuD/methylene tetrahydromethanopterin reductase-like flavin-dependent oxidoreductase (luciferase family)